MNIPKSSMEPFGYTGIPQVFCREMAENFLEETIKGIVEEMEARQREQTKLWIIAADPIVQDMLSDIRKRFEERFEE